MQKNLQKYYRFNADESITCCQKCENYKKCMIPYGFSMWKPKAYFCKEISKKLFELLQKRGTKITKSYKYTYYVCENYKGLTVNITLEDLKIAHDEHIFLIESAKKYRKDENKGNKK
ncbi:MAG: hypothetical protein ABFD07_19465 [Methanobacterium sp.]